MHAAMQISAPCLLPFCSNLIYMFTGWKPLVSAPACRRLGTLGLMWCSMQVGSVAHRVHPVIFLLKVELMRVVVVQRTTKAIAEQFLARCATRISFTTLKVSYIPHVKLWQPCRDERMIDCWQTSPNNAPRSLLLTNF